MKSFTLFYSTVTPLLKSILTKLMKEEIFTPFRLVGGTNLSLRFGHRKSIDIDLFTDAEYGTLDFGLFENYLKKEFKYFDCPDSSEIVGFGRSYYIGENAEESIKLDLMYTDKFISEVETIDGIRFASVEDIIAMKLCAVNNGGRKKDFWDLHMLLQEYDLDTMITFFLKRHFWEGDRNDIKRKLLDFRDVDDDFNPICLLNKDWDLIKLDFIHEVNKLKD